MSGRMEKKPRFTEDELEIVVARLQTMPYDARVAMGNLGVFGREQLIQHVKKMDNIGTLVATAYLNQLRSFKKQVETLEVDAGKAKTR